MVAEIAQLAEEVAGGLVALLGLLGEAAVDGPLERRGQLFVDGRRVFADDGGHGFNGAGAGEGLLCRRPARRG
jgi:hypothetical protein